MDWDTHWPEAKRQWLVLHGATGLVEDDIVYNNTRLRKVAATSDTFRPDPGNWPTILYRVQPSRRALILTHGLTDSPAFVKAIGSAFAEHGMGHTVLMPLLPGHGRTNPEGAMAKCTYEDWRKVVDDTVAVAHMIADEVSIAASQRAARWLSTSFSVISMQSPERCICFLPHSTCEILRSYISERTWRSL